MPHNLIGRVAIRILAIEWWAMNAVLSTLIAVVCAFVGWWIWAGVTGLIACALWAHVVHDEVQARREEHA